MTALTRLSYHICPVDVNIFLVKNSVFSLLHHLMENILDIIPSCKQYKLWYYIDTGCFK